MSLGKDNPAASFDANRWRRLLRDIHAGQVLPVIGPELITITLPEKGKMSLSRHLAEQLAERLNVTLPFEQETSLSTVTCAWLLDGGASIDVYDELRDLVDHLDAPPCQALLDLASISDFSLYISTTFDPLMGQALKQMRPGFLPDRNSMDFHPNDPRDLPDPKNMPKPFLYHILGTHDTYPDFVVWEEDHIEYLCGLLRAQDNLRVLSDYLRNKDLLFIGSPFADWVVRLFLRMAKSKRLFETRVQGRQDYVADKPSHIARPTIFFFERQVGSTRIIAGDPSAFIAELAEKWRENYGVVKRGDDILQRMAEDMPRDSVFISYSRDDQVAAVEMAAGLLAAQVPVWLDRGRLAAGENYERSLEHAVKNDASFFISLISRATEADPNRFVHRERVWAAQRHVDGFVFYIPVLIEDLPKVQQEPAEFAKAHQENLPGGRVSPEFVGRMQKLIIEYRLSGRPRG